LIFVGRTSELQNPQTLCVVRAFSPTLCLLCCFCSPAFSSEQTLSSISLLIETSTTTDQKATKAYVRGEIKRNN
jgi:hypothetical protein